MSEQCARVHPDEKCDLCQKKTGGAPCVARRPVRL